MTQQLSLEGPSGLINVLAPGGQTDPGWQGCRPGEPVPSARGLALGAAVGPGRDKPHHTDFGSAGIFQRFYSPCWKQTHTFQGLGWGSTRGLRRRQRHPGCTQNQPVIAYAATPQGARGLSTPRAFHCRSVQSGSLGSRKAPGCQGGAGQLRPSVVRALSWWGVERTQPPTETPSQQTRVRTQPLLSAGPLLVLGNNAEGRAEEEHPFLMQK